MCIRDRDWGLEDPSGGPEETYLSVLARIEERVRDLRQRLKTECV